MPPDIVLHRWDDLPLEKVTEMVARKTVSGAELAVTQAYFKKGTLVPVHGHDTELFIYVLQGALRARLGANDITVREGEVLVVPAGVAHQAESLDDTFLISITRLVAPAPAPSAR
jgi:quercetin dioxygenase-like cupin family protein